MGKACRLVWRPFKARLGSSHRPRSDLVGMTAQGSIWQESPPKVRTGRNDRSRFHLAGLAGYDLANLTTKPSDRKRGFPDHRLGFDLAGLERRFGDRLGRGPSCQHGQGLPVGLATVQGSTWQESPPKVSTGRGHRSRSGFVADTSQGPIWRHRAREKCRPLPSDRKHGP